ncbi:MAG: hypothetical protein JO236_00425 [Mycobacterium sp.]|uniref:hypothetical protein n=1 Tax=Mycobacterium sp. TaxID=1785 RepID=UPI001ED1ED78|nr:hypothetical protein [Mycobacterium sp.]MBW0016005.1 hypothetical protein [Mycobacterium sp.]
MFPFAGAVRLICVSAAMVVGATAVALPAWADPNKLMGMLPAGFSSSNCQEATPKPPALEKVTCDQSSEPGGPTAAVFGLFGNANDVASGFQTVAEKVTISPSCPGNQSSPGTWTFASNGQTGGQVECGTIGDDSGKSAVVVWSDNAKLRVGVVRGPDIASLYQWWGKKSG